MRKMITIVAVMLAIFVLASPSVMAGNLFKWLRDDDGDGIPNCIDPDYVRPEDGSGYGKLDPSLTSVVPSGDKDQTRDRDQIRDRDQLKDGSCNEICTPNVYKLSYKWDGTKK